MYVWYCSGDTKQTSIMVGGAPAAGCHDHDRVTGGLRDQCTTFLVGHGPVTASGMLASIPPDTVPDRYGDGGVVTELETEVAGLLGKPAAAFLPSGTMAQQLVLRVHADQRQRRTVVF